MKTIEYDMDGLAIADHKAEETARAFLQSDDSYIKVSTDNFVTAVRVLIHEKFIAHTEVEFLFKGTKLPPNKNGRLNHWPLGFCDTHEDLLSRLLTKQ
jgi:hypothetical protein